MAAKGKHDNLVVFPHTYLSDYANHMQSSFKSHASHLLPNNALHGNQEVNIGQRLLHPWVLYKIATQ